MPFIPNTPESLLPRSDSRNPAATCRGLTGNGRPCRRAIAKTKDGFCWQHTEQFAHASPQILPATIRERTSVDTLVDRLGLLEVEERKRRKPVSDPEKRVEPRRQRPKPKSNLALLCCIGEADEVRPPRPVRPKIDSVARIPRPKIARDPSSRTGEFLSLIPPSTSPQTTALLLAELAKPFSQHDDDGYIYMFWLTPESLPSNPPSEIAPSLLSTCDQRRASGTLSPSRPTGQRRTSDVLNSFATTISNKKTILLKIGRAQNVQRRLNQWTRQCGYNLSLIRFYPYSSTMTPRKVPNVHKVERLIHIELGAKRAGRNCDACGKQHREWFEVEASREGVRAVDEMVRRWVDWAERQR
jgi:hypothetical protein